MAKQVPNLYLPQETYDTDAFIAFTLDGKDSLSKFGVYRVSDGKRYNWNLLPTMKDNTTTIQSNDGLILRDSYFTQRQIQIKIAYDHMTEEQLRNLRQALGAANGQRKYHDLILAEHSDRVWHVQVSGKPQLNYICFNDETEYYPTRIYKGEGTLTFITYDPFAYDLNETEYTYQSGGTNTYTYNGTAPAPFVLSTAFTDSDEVQEHFGYPFFNYTGEEISNGLWDSETGLVYQTNSEFAYSAQITTPDTTFPPSIIHEGDDDEGTRPSIITYVGPTAIANVAARSNIYLLPGQTFTLSEGESIRYTNRYL